MGNLLEKAIDLAVRAHAGQKDKAALPYILHPLRVMMKFSDDEDMMIIAILHDIVEDTDLTLNDLRDIGFSKRVILAIDCLTRRVRETYEDFINRVMTNNDAVLVKIADINDNMDISRLKYIGEKDIIRLNKYIEASNKLKKHLNKCN